MPIYPPKSKIKKSVGGKRKYTSSNDSDDDDDDDTITDHNGGELQANDNNDELQVNVDVDNVDNGGRRPTRKIQQIIYADAPNRFNSRNNNQGWRDNQEWRSSTTTSERRRRRRN